MDREHALAAGRQIARWAPRAGSHAEDRERYAQAVADWLAATGRTAEDAATRAQDRRAGTATIGGMGAAMVAHVGWTAEDFRRDGGLYRLDLDHVPGKGCAGLRRSARGPVRYKSLVRRPDGREAGALECERCGAVRELVDKTPAAPLATTPPRGVEAPIEPAEADEEERAAVGPSGASATVEVAASGSDVAATEASSGGGRGGRPRGSRVVGCDQIVTTFRRLRAKQGRNPTQAEVCVELRPRIEPPTLRATLKDCGRSWADLVASVAD